MSRTEGEPAGHPIRIVSYNVHACVGRDGRFAPGRIADILQSLEADFIALQEVEDRIHEGRRVSDYLADRLGMQAYRGATLKRGDAHYGNLLLAKTVAADHRLHDISVPGREPRGAVEAEFTLGRKTLRLFVTHLGLRSDERAHQIRRLLPELERDDADIRVLAGDMNEWRAAGASRALRRAFGGSLQRRTFPTVLPVLSLDRIYVTPPGALLNIRPVTDPPARQASDHLPLLAEIGIAHEA
ncbi:MAG: endonuclease/exonuclease/phosphatase family protein [Gammaproteobacteria bacterium]|jgi:endonuclease/exonuclease/phosphatase family metal-dependent hydrolase